MQDETFLSGYCRQLDQSRMVTVVTENNELCQIDCCFGSCVYQSGCPIAKQILELQTK